MIFRPAAPDELPELQRRLDATDGERIDLETTPAWVAERDGEILGILPARLFWNLEPLVIFDEVTNRLTRSRAALGLYRAAEAYLADPMRNRTGCHWIFCFTRSDAVKGWANRLGWLRQWKGAAAYVKCLRNDRRIG